MTDQTARSVEQRRTSRSALRIGILLGVGSMGALDEIIFHQLLQWHHFYDHSTAYWRIFSDGLFHAFTSSMLVLAAALLWAQRRPLSQLMRGRVFWAGVVLGAGGFQLFDGTVNHKLLQIHSVREGVPNILPYDLGWNASALLLLLVAWMVWRGVRASDAESD